MTAGLTVWKASLTGMLDENHSQSFYNLFAVLNAASVFAACTYLAGRGGALRRPLLRRLCALLQSMGSCTLGIYLLHLFFHQRLPFMGRLWDVFRVRLGLGDMISAFLYCGGDFPHGIWGDAGAEESAVGAAAGVGNRNNSAPKSEQ